jgi:hypothetical protein
VLNRSFLSRTGQLWKLTAGILCTAVGLAIIMSIVHFEVSSEIGIPGVASGLALTSGGFLWMMLSIRCPSCKARVMWKAARQNEAGGSRPLDWPNEREGKLPTHVQRPTPARFAAVRSAPSLQPNTSLRRCANSRYAAS